MWIRSQDKTRLRKCDYFDISKPDKKEFFITDNGDVFGVYKSKKRCMQILDKIQKVIEGNIEFENDLNYGITTYKLPDKVYQMPEK